MECWPAVELEKDALARFVRDFAEVRLDPLLDHFDVRCLCGVVGAARLRKMKKTAWRENLPELFRDFLFAWVLRARADDHLCGIMHFAPNEFLFCASRVSEQMMDRKNTPWELQGRVEGRTCSGGCGYVMSATVSWFGVYAGKYIPALSVTWSWSPPPLVRLVKGKRQSLRCLVFLENSRSWLALVSSALMMRKFIPGYLPRVSA